MSPDEVDKLIDDIVDDAIQANHPEMVRALKLHIATLEHIIYDYVASVHGDYMDEPSRKVYLAIVTPNPPTLLDPPPGAPEDT